jgi:hypothetical protein
MSKKRGSVSNNNLVSPALRPKISPSIKPLLPEGGEFYIFPTFVSSVKLFSEQISPSKIASGI